MNTPALPRHLPVAAGCNQLINWGITFYMPGTFVHAIAADMRWSSPQIYFGLTLAMLVMAVISPFIARLLACFGGRAVVMTGTLLIALSCVVMAYVHSLPGWYAAWFMAGIGMRLSLYDALFASLVNLYGQNARKLISRVTLAGGLASAVFWPLGAKLLMLMNWRDALLIYALSGVLSAVLIRALPHHTVPVPTKRQTPQIIGKRDRRNSLLYGSFIAIITFVSNGTSTHLPEFIASFGLPAAVGMLLSRPQWMGISPAVLVMLASAVFYLRLELRLGLLMTVLLALSVWLGHTLAGLSTAAWLAWGIGLFVVGWVFQFVGHYFEGQIGRAHV